MQLNHLLIIVKILIAIRFNSYFIYPTSIKKLLLPGVIEKSKVAINVVKVNEPRLKACFEIPERNVQA